MQQRQGMTAQSTGMQCDCYYFKTRPAISKIVQVVSSLIAFVCPQNLTSIDCGGCVEWFRTAAMSGLLFSCIFLFVYFLHIHEKLERIPWLKIDLIACFFWTIFDFSTSTKMAITLNTCHTYGNCSSNVGLTAAASVAIIFGYVATIAYAFDVVVSLWRMRITRA